MPVELAGPCLHLLASDLRPPALDELGLASALRERASSSLPGAVVVESDADGAPLSAAIEVVACRIATEALANAARHSGTDQVAVRVAVCPRMRRAPCDSP